MIRKLLLAAMVVFAQLEGQARQPQVSRPNILFIMLDDVGKDQLASFNPAADTVALTPNLNAIAAGGVTFTNFMTMPECSPSRVAFFTGRYPFRTGVTAAILDQDLPASQISPFEVTIPKVLSAVGYRSAMIGKYHLGGPENNPDGNGAPIALGWDYFNGMLRAAPAFVDTSLGGQYTRDSDKYSCGFPAGTARGACWFQGAGNQARCDDNQGTGYTGQQAVALGGIPALDAQGNFARSCREAAGSGPNFFVPNGYYVWPQVIADSSGVQTPPSRQYATTAQTDGAIAWIRRQSQGPDRFRPWMATVSYSAIHTPYQPPPIELYPPGFVWPSNVPENCTDPAAVHILGDLMLAAVDREIGRLLVSAGLASRDERGELVYRPESTDTMVVIVGDNGTDFPSVKAPYDPLRAKFTPYQTGVSAPLIVAGPLVAGQGRSVEHLVNAVDLFQLFGEIADIDDVREVVPSSHVLDSEPVLPYLTNPNQPSERRFSFTQLSPGLKPSSVKVWPCVQKIDTQYTANDHLFTFQGACELDGGTWFGPTPDRPDPPYPTSCAIKAAGLYSNLEIAPTRVWAIRNRQYKLVKAERASCESSLGEYEFYDLSVRSPSNPLGLDLTTADLLTNGQPVGLTMEQTANFVELENQLHTLLNSERVCPGDGNLDKRVDIEDVFGVVRYRGQPSVFDFNVDGVTDIQDLTVVMNNYGNECR